MADYTIPDMGSAYAEGMKIGEAYRQRKRDDRAREGLGRYLSAGDRAGLDQAYQNDPDAAFKAQQAVQKQQGDAQTVAANFAKAWSAAPPQAKPNLISAARRTIAQRPDLQQVLGDQLPQTDDPAEWDNFLGQGQLYAEPERFSNAGGGVLVGSGGTTKKIEGYDAPSRVKLVTVPTGDGGSRQMLFDPDTQTFSEPNYDGQPPPRAAPPPQQNTIDTSIDINSLPPGEREAAMMAAQGQDAHVVNGVAVPGNTLEAQQMGARGPQRAPAPVQARSSYADTPLDQVGGGTPSAPRMGYKPPPARAGAKGPPAGAKAPAGYRWAGDGAKLEPIPGGPADRSQKGGAARPQAPVRPTEDMAKAAAWYAQASNAYKNLRKVYDNNPEAASPGLLETYGPAGEVANRSRTPDRQKYVQAASSLSEAFLRAATGAGITIDEAKQKFEELTPVRGDSAEVIQQKLDAIPVYLESLKNRAGTAVPMTSAPTAADASAATGPMAPPTVRWTRGPGGKLVKVGG